MKYCHNICIKPEIDLCKDEENEYIQIVMDKLAASKSEDIRIRKLPLFTIQFILNREHNTNDILVLYSADGVIKQEVYDMSRVLEFTWTTAESSVITAEYKINGLQQKRIIKLNYNPTATW